MPLVGQTPTDRRFLSQRDDLPELAGRSMPGPDRQASRHFKSSAGPCLMPASSNAGTRADGKHHHARNPATCQNAEKPVRQQAQFAWMAATTLWRNARDLRYRSSCECAQRNSAIPDDHNGTQGPPGHTELFCQIA